MRLNDKFYRKVAFLMYTEMVNFRPQSLKAASKQKPYRGLGTRLPYSVLSLYKRSTLYKECLWVINQF